jgi:hypothetical protein
LNFFSIPNYVIEQNEAESHVDFMVVLHVHLGAFEFIVMGNVSLFSSGNTQEEGAERRSPRSYSILGQIVNDV